jgi:pimeloyl-ACP methyl ester carboxylesterase
MKTAFLISGYKTNRTAADEKYDDLRKAIASKGFQVVPVPFVWNYTTVTQYVDKFITFYAQHKSDYNVIIGNSYGAMVAFLATPKIVPNEVVLCSLSPNFNEDKDKTTVQYRLKRFGKRREAAMRHLSAAQTAKAINQTNTKVVMLYGQQENEVYPHLVERVKSTAKDLRNVQLIEVPDAPHSFSDPAYIKGIESALASYHPVNCH